MNELAFIKKSDVFSNSWIIAQNIGYPHKNITKHIEKHKARFEQMGGTFYSGGVKSTGGRPAKPFDLNEQQAFFIMTLLGNENEIVLDFKMKLAMEFVKMRKLLLQKQTADWQQTRIQSKQVRLQETDAIQLLIEYAKEQGSKNSKMLYLSYSKLVKGLAECENREIADIETLTMIIAFEKILHGVIVNEMKLNTHYKEIYHIAKAQLNGMKRLWAMPRISA